MNLIIIFAKILYMDNTFIQALVMAFREGLEAFLIITIMLRFLEKSGRVDLKKHVWTGVFTGISISILFGLILYKISDLIGGIKTTAKLWESVAGFFAVLLVTSFIIWMIKNGSKIKDYIENETAMNLSKKAIIPLVVLMVAREGTEIAIFSFAGKYSFVPIIIGLIISIFLVVLINFSLVKVNLKTIFQITLIYLIFQAGYLLGYSIHEGLSALKEMNILRADNILFTKAFNVYGTVLNHKKGLIGLPLNVLFGWYSKPEWIQLILHYTFTGSLLYYFKKKN